MKKNFFTKRKIITFYPKMEKQKIFEKKKKIFLPNAILNRNSRVLRNSVAVKQYLPKITILH